MMDIYVSYNSNGIHKLTLDHNWDLQKVTRMFIDNTYYLGLDYYKDHFYFVTSSVKKLFKLNRNWEIVTCITLPHQDAHGVDCFDDKVVVTNPSGMHMEIYDLDLELIAHIPIPLHEKVIHKNIVRHHVNSAQSNSAGEIYYTVTYMVDHEVISHISRRENGYIMKIVNYRHIPVVSGIHLPHSLRIKGDYMYVCNKNGFHVEKYTFTGEFVNRTESLDGWVRGLCPLDDDIWLVGLNCARTDGFPIKRKSAEILVLKEQNNVWEVLNQFNLGGCKEIFDIIEGPKC